MIHALSATGSAFHRCTAGIPLIKAEIVEAAYKGCIRDTFCLQQILCRLNAHAVNIFGGGMTGVFPEQADDIGLSVVGVFKGKRFGDVGMNAVKQCCFLARRLSCAVRTTWDSSPRIRPLF